VADAVAIRIGFLPELFGGKRCDPLVQAKANFFKISSKRSSDDLAKVWHWPVRDRSDACGGCDSKPSFLKIQISTFSPCGG
jgi:hypothetical protein